MKKIFIAYYLLFCSSVTIYCADIFLVNNIYFEGLQRVTVGAMLFSMPVRIGDIATDENIRNTISTLFYTGNFEDIRVFSDKDSLVIQVKERPTISSIIFLGNKEVKDELLKNKLDAQGIMVGKVLNRTTISNIEIGIEDFYCSIGKYRAMVKAIVTLLPSNMVDLKIVLIEGESAKINKINILGNNIFTTNELMLSLKLKDEVNWWNIVSDSKYNKNKIYLDIEKLRNFYLDRGYACFDIFSTNVNITPDKKSIYISININEGAKYKLSGIVVNLNIAASSNLKEVIEIYKIKNIELYNINKIKKIEKNINKLLGCYGYAYPNVLTKNEINYINKTIKLHVNIDTGNRLYVRYINLCGNNITKDLVLRSEIQQMEGTLLSSYLVDKGRESLKSIGYAVDTDIIMINSYDHVDVIYNIKERKTGSIYAGIGLGTERGISFNFGIKQDNLFGTGNLVELHGKRNCYKTYTEFSITDPYITFDGVSFNGKIVYNSFKAANLSDYNLRIYNFISTLSFPINDNQKLSIGLDYVNYYLTNIKQQVAMLSYINGNWIIIDNNINSEEKYNFINKDLFLTIGWCYNNLDRCYLPNAGASANFLGKLKFNYSKSKYYNITFDIHNYIPFTVNKNFILMGRASIVYTTGSKDVSFLDNFYAGCTVRGFSSNKKKSSYYRYNSSTYLSNSYSTKIFSYSVGNAMTIISSELIFPTPFLSKEYTNSVRTSFFIDAGTVLDTYYNTEYTRATGIHDYCDNYNIRISCGISVQWMSNIGPIVLSYAKPIKIYTGDKLEQFQFNIGKIW